jgi:AcrR family transcriptional regulator
MANVRTPRSAWVDEGLRALADGGPDAVRVEALARRLGVSKGGFYWYFADRQALLTEMLDAWEHLFIDEVIAHLDSGGGDGRQKLRRLFALAAAAGEPLKIDPAVRAWAKRDKSVARRLRRVDNRRMAYMRSLFSQFCPDADEVEARCLIVMSLFIGGHLVAADHDGRSRADVLALALKKLED